MLSSKIKGQYDFRTKLHLVRGVVQISVNEFLFRGALKHFFSQQAQRACHQNLFSRRASNLKDIPRIGGCGPPWATFERAP